MREYVAIDGLVYDNTISPASSLYTVAFSVCRHNVNPHFYHYYLNSHFSTDTSQEHM